MESISIRVTDAQLKHLRTKENASAYLRELISRDMEEKVIEFNIEATVRRVIEEMGVTGITEKSVGVESNLVDGVVNSLYEL